MRLQYLSDEGLADLKGNFPRNLSHYSAGDRGYFSELLERKGYLFDTGIEIEDFCANLWSDDGVNKENASKNDAHNAYTLYQAMKELPLPMAIDEKIWSCLCHTVLFDFICKKREKDFEEGQKGYERKIENSFFTYTSNGKRRGTFVNCIASLWWGAYMVYDAAAENPYHFLPDIAMTGYPSTLVILSSSRILGRKETCLGFFQAIHALRAQGCVFSRQDVVEGLKHLNLLAGLTILDFKDRSEIASIVTAFYDDFFQQGEMGATFM